MIRKNAGSGAVRVIFMGSPDFSVPALEALAADGHMIVGVYCQPPRPAGRGGKERPTAVHARALEMGFGVRHPMSLNPADVRDEFAALGADVAVVAAYGMILPRPLLAAPRRGCVNIHASLLPRWRGAAPIHRAILAGDAETGVGIMRMEEGLDTGPVLLERRVGIGSGETAGELHDRLSRLGAEMIVEALRDFDELEPRPQARDGATYADKIDKAEARIDFARPAVEVDRLIRGLSPFPGAWCGAGGRRLKILRCRPADESGAPGEIIGEGVVACGDGAVEMIEVRPEGKRSMSAVEWLRGHGTLRYLS